MRPSSFLAVLLVGGCSASPSSSTDLPAGISSGALFSGVGSSEDVARALLHEKASAPGRSFRLFTTREGRAGTYLRFQQYETIGAESLRVWDGEVVVLVRGGEVRAVNQALREEASRALPVDAASKSSAGAQALSLLGVDAQAFEKVIHVDASGMARVAWLVTAETDAPPHAWSLLLDAVTLKELERRDGVKHATGQGYVFDMNAVASSGNLALVDGNGATTAALDAARFLVDLPVLDGSGPLRGPYADARTKNVGSRAQSATLQFLYDRSQSGFKQTNVYFHLTRAQQRIQGLGFSDVNNRVQVAVVDENTQDNSYYSPADKGLHFGTGGVDDAEDGDIVLHEYGHSVQDNQVPGWGGSDEDSMGEGFGDYLAASFSDGLPADAGHPQLTSAACVGEWDSVAYGTPDPQGMTCLRRTDEAKHYPEDEEGESHADGELWSAALWALRGQLGADTMDSLVFEGHFLLTTSASFFTAAQAVITADANVNGGANATTLRRGFIKYGLLRTLSPAADGGVTSTVTVSVDPPRSGTTYLGNADDSQTLTVPGAAGLRVHFTRVELETSPQCLSSSCDNIYVLNGVGDLFQVVTGVATTGLTTVAVPGDTVVVRLVSDSTTNRFGYHVDRLDVLGVTTDAGVVDAGVPVVDAGVPDAGPVEPDAGVPDAGPSEPDAGIPDAGPSEPDASVPDAGPSEPDAGAPDAGAPDAGAPDAGAPDAGAPDAGVRSDGGFDSGISWPMNDGGIDSGVKSDAGTSTDAGVQVTVFLPAAEVEEDAGSARGCGCGAAGAGAGELFAALSVLGLFRRRRRGAQG